MSRVFPAVIVLLALVLLPMIPVQANGSGTVVSIPDATVGPGAEVTLPINITNITDVGAITIRLCYNPTIVTIPAGGIANGTMGNLTSTINNITGEANMTWYSITGETDDFVFAYVTLKAVGSRGNTSPLNLDVRTLKNTYGNSIAYTVDNGTFTIGLMEGNATLEGHVDLQGLPATNVTVRFFAPNTTTEYVAMKTHTSTDSNGNFTIPGIDSGTYDVAVKGQTSLSNLESGVNFTGGGTTYRDFGVLLEGDASGDDYVDGSDFGPLSDAWLSYPGCPKGNWNPDVDFSRDNYIDGSDFGPLSDDWLKWGDCFGWPGNWT